MGGAKGLLINITGGEDLTLFEVDQAVTRIRDEVDEDANVIFGSAIDETLNGRIRVSVVATGIDSPHNAAAKGPRLVAVGGAKPEPQPIPVPPGAAAASPTMTAQSNPVPQLRQTSSLREVPVMEAPQPIFTRPEQPRQAPNLAPAMQAQATAPTRQPLQPALQPDTATRSDPRPSLFAAPGRPQPATPVSVPAPNPAPSATFTPYVPPNAGPSIFSRVTGAFRRRSPGAQDAPVPRQEQAYAPAHVTPVARAESPDHEAEGHDILDVPTFLRRQQSAP